MLLYAIKFIYFAIYHLFDKAHIHTEMNNGSKNREDQPFFEDEYVDDGFEDASVQGSKDRRRPDEGTSKPGKDSAARGAGRGNGGFDLPLDDEYHDDLGRPAAGQDGDEDEDEDEDDDDHDDYYE